MVLEEINMVEDTPDDLVFDLLAAKLWPVLLVVGVLITAGCLAAWVWLRRVRAGSGIRQ